MQSRHREVRQRASALRPTEREAASPQEQHVTFRDRHMMVPFRSFEIRRIDRIARLNPFNATNLRYIDQHAAADDSVACDIDRAFVRTLKIDLTRREAVVHLAAPEMMAQRIEMGGREAVRLN